MVKYLHDTHFHLDLYNDDIPQIVEDIEMLASYTIAVTNLPPLYSKLNKTINSKYIRVALGFHPELITEYKKYIPEMWRYLDNVKYIGEVGLDLKEKSEIDRKNQICFFEELIYRCNLMGGKILSIHSRGSEEKLLSLLGDSFNGTVILHWYSGALKLLDDAIQKKFYFSINYAMLQSAKGKKIIERIPEIKLLIESDAPFIKINNKRFKPSDLEMIVKGLAILKNIGINDMKDLLTKNLKHIVV
ncbi:MAG: TatD family hydrolase [Candidatus Anammoxibacter sp.]